MSLSGAKLALKGTLGSSWLGPIWSPLTAGRVAIFAMHRFADPELGVHGHDPAELATALERLRRERYHVMELADAVRRLQHGEPLPRRAVVFTVDDAYLDFATVGAGVFQAYDCPVTVFAPTGFVDGTSWMWWDQIAFIVASTPLREIRIDLDGAPWELQVPRPELRAAAAHRLAVRCTALPTWKKRRFIVDLAAAARVHLPTTAPERYRALSWDDALRLERTGVTFGPHTVDHPVLIRAHDAESAWQIEESWRVLRTKLRNPVPVFAYPNGDHSAREARTVNRLGLAGAVTCVQEYASRRSSDDGVGGLAAIPRFAYPDAAADVCLTASGFVRVMSAMRSVRQPAGV
jgi:peptidoglycan/xylan/chitin deacetylase (PgdA/CDA1 family)